MGGVGSRDSRGGGDGGGGGGLGRAVEEGAAEGLGAAGRENRVALEGERERGRVVEGG